MNDLNNKLAEGFLTWSAAMPPEVATWLSANPPKIEMATPAPAEPSAWLVLDKDGTLIHAAAWREAAHEHINDAINEHGVSEAARWVVRPAFTAPMSATPAAAPLAAICEVIRISDRSHPAWDEVKVWLAGQGKEASK